MRRFAKLVNRDTEKRRSSLLLFNCICVLVNPNQNIITQKEQQHINATRMEQRNS